MTLWFFIGIFYAGASLYCMQKSVFASTSSVKSLPSLSIVGGSILRLFVISFLILSALKSHVYYALLLIAGYTLARIILLYRMSKKADEENLKQERILNGNN